MFVNYILFKYTNQWINAINCRIMCFHVHSCILVLYDQWVVVYEYNIYSTCKYIQFILTVYRYSYAEKVI